MKNGTMTGEEVRCLWNWMDNILFDEDGDGDLVFSEDYGPFRRGDSLQEYAYNWFDENYDGGIFGLLYGDGKPE